MAKNRVVIGGIYRTRDVARATYKPGSIVRVVQGSTNTGGVRTELIFGERAGIYAVITSGFVWLHELEELE